MGDRGRRRRGAAKSCLVHFPYQELYNSSFLWETPVPILHWWRPKAHGGGRGQSQGKCPLCLIWKPPSEWLARVGSPLCPHSSRRLHPRGVMCHSTCWSLCSCFRLWDTWGRKSRPLVVLECWLVMGGWEGEWIDGMMGTRLFKAQPSPQSRMKCLRAWGRGRPGFEPYSPYTFGKCLFKYFSIFIEMLVFLFGCVRVIYIFWIQDICDIHVLWLSFSQSCSLHWIFLTVSLIKVINFDETYFINFFLL